MKDFETLTQRGQLHRIKQLATQALKAFDDIDVARVSLLDHGENTTFRARTKTKYEGLATHLSSDSLLIRCHRPGYNSPQAIESELLWLDALHDAGVPVQVPLRTSTGDGVVNVEFDGVPGGRRVSVLRWVDGRIMRKSTVHHMKRLGVLMAQLHEHAKEWEPPEGFERPSITMASRFNVSQDLGTPALIERMTDQQAQTHHRATSYVEGVYASIGEDVLIHADLHMGNMVFSDGQARPIDFDDCGTGPLAYDFAVALMSWHGKPDFEARVEAFVQGYTGRAGHAPDLTHMEDMIIARMTEMSLWLIDRARNVKEIRDNLDKWMASRSERMDVLLDQRSAPS